MGENYPTRLKHWPNNLPYRSVYAVYSWAVHLAVLPSLIPNVSIYPSSTPTIWPEIIMGIKLHEIAFKLHFKNITHFNLIKWQQLRIYIHTYVVSRKLILMGIKWTVGVKNIKMSNFNFPSNFLTTATVVCNA